MDSCAVYAMSMVDKIMLKYRPIAPKPVAAGSGSGSGGSEISNGYVTCGRRKRKYRVNKNRKKKENNNSKKRKVTTLSLLPETPARKDNEPGSNFSGSVKPTKWLGFNKLDEKGGYGVDPVVKILEQPQPPRQPPRQPKVVSYVTVECITDTWVDLQQGLGCKDAERVKSDMEMDTCPGFISDGEDRVIWTNEAYRQMAGVEHVFGGDDSDMTVVLVRKDKRSAATPPVGYPNFTCKVRVASAVHTATAAAKRQTLPCDVWRMDRGACAWRLDVKAALSLGR